MSFGQYYMRGPRWRRGPGWHRRRRYWDHYPERVIRPLWAWPYAGFGSYGAAGAIGQFGISPGDCKPGEVWNPDCDNPLNPGGKGCCEESVSPRLLKTHAGYSYYVVPEKNVSELLAEISQSLAPAIPVPSGTTYLGAALPIETVIAGKKGEPGIPLIQWIHARAAEGYGLVVSEVETAPLVPMPAKVGEGIVIATKNVRLAEAITTKDDSSAVILEPTGGWLVAEVTAAPSTKKAGLPGGAIAVFAALAIMGGVAIVSRQKKR